MEQTPEKRPDLLQEQLIGVTPKSQQSRINKLNYRMKRSLNLRKEPFVLLLVTTVILLFALALRPIANLDFQDKVMFGIPLDNMVWFMPFFLLAFWLIYVATNKLLYSIAITWVRVLTTVTATLLIVILLYVGISPSMVITERHEIIGNAMQFLTISFLLGQLLFLANIGLGIIARLKVK